jgi:hypothetical protein
VPILLLYSYVSGGGGVSQGTAVVGFEELRKVYFIECKAILVNAYLGGPVPWNRDQVSCC